MSRVNGSVGVYRKVMVFEAINWATPPVSFQLWKPLCNDYAA